MCNNWIVTTRWDNSQSIDWLPFLFYYYFPFLSSFVLSLRIWCWGLLTPFSRGESSSLYLYIIMLVIVVVVFEETGELSVFSDTIITSTFFKCCLFEQVKTYRYCILLYRMLIICPILSPFENGLGNFHLGDVVGVAVTGVLSSGTPVRYTEEYFQVLLTSFFPFFWTHSLYVQIGLCLMTFKKLMQKHASHFCFWNIMDDFSQKYLPLLVECTLVKCPLKQQ